MALMKKTLSFSRLELDKAQATAEQAERDGTLVSMRSQPNGHIIITLDTSEKTKKSSAREAAERLFSKE
jgi:hypothetical protein